jgi:hypothetical protein
MLEGRACHAWLEGHVYRARGREMDHPTWRSGRNKRVPPKAKLGGACLSCPPNRMHGSSRQIGCKEYRN